MAARHFCIIPLFLFLFMIFRMSCLSFPTFVSEVDTKEPTASVTSSKVVYNASQPHNHLNNSFVFVCITGQLSRLELHNKIRKLFLPLHHRGYKLYIGLALDNTNTSHYTNKDNGDQMQLYTSISQVQKTLLDVKGVFNVRHFHNSSDMENLPFNSYYQKSLTNKSSSYVNRTAAQFKVLQHCNHWSRAASRSAFFVRMREDTFIDHIDLDPIIKLARNGSVVTTACDAWRGMNDKMAFGPSSRAKEFFLFPFQCYKYQKDIIDRFNSEQLYKNCYEKHGFTVIASDDFVVTKAVTTIEKEYLNTTHAHITCTITGNPFQKWTTNCPPEGVSLASSYSAYCHATTESSLLNTTK